jgi:hypothetical protein
MNNEMKTKDADPTKLSPHLVQYNLFIFLFILGDVLQRLLHSTQ